MAKFEYNYNGKGGDVYINGYPGFIRLGKTTSQAELKILYLVGYKGVNKIEKIELKKAKKSETEDLD